MIGRTLDRYLLWKFLGVLVFSTVAMVTIFIAVNYVENIDKFIDRQVPNSVILEYYINFLPYIVVLTLPIDMLLACLFSVGSMSRYNELAATKSTGISIYRTMSPLLLIAVLISFFNFYLSEVIVPDANSRRIDLWKEHVEKSQVRYELVKKNISMFNTDGRKIFIESFDARSEKATNVTIHQYDGQKLLNRIDCIECSWIDSTRSWVLKKGAIRTFENGTEKVEHFGQLIRNDLAFTPEDLMKRYRNPEEMGYEDLRDFIHKLRLSGGRTVKWETDLQIKLSYPFTCFFIVLFGAPIASIRSKGGPAAAVVICLVTCFAYWILIQFGKFLGYDEVLSPIQAGWLGNLVCFLVSLVFLFRVRT